MGCLRAESVASGWRGWCWWETAGWSLRRHLDRLDLERMDYILGMPLRSCNS